MTALAVRVGKPRGRERRVPYRRESMGMRMDRNLFNENLYCDRIRRHKKKASKQRGAKNTWAIRVKGPKALLLFSVS